MKETEKEQPVGVEGDPGEWYAPEAKWHLACFFFFFYIYKGNKSTHLKNDFNPVESF